MKVLQINSVCKTGSTGKIMYDIHSELIKNNIESIVCYGRRDKINEKYVYKVCSELYSYFNHFIANITGVPYKGFYFSTKKLINIIKDESPDIVHIHCLNGYFVDVYKLIEWLKNNNVKTVLTLHAEFMYTGGCEHAIDCNKWLESTGCHHCDKLKKEFHSKFFDRTHYMWKRMIRTFEGFDRDKLIITSVSPWIMERAKQSYALRNYKHITILNGLDTKVFHSYDNSDLYSLRQKHDLKDEKIIFHATPFFNNDPNHIKGGYYVLELAKLMENENVKFIVAGPYDNKIIKPHNFIFLGHVSDQIELAKYYSMADITLLTSKRETFSMVTAESISCGTPVVGFKAGAPEMIALEKYSEFVEYGRCDLLYKACMESLNNNIENMSEKMYSKKTMTDKYIDVYKNILGEDK